MNNPTAKTEESLLASYSQEQVDILRKHIAPGFTDNELIYCLNVAKARGLDPFQKQIYFSKRSSKINGVWTERVQAEPTIDGFRVIANRTGEMDGEEDPVWCGADGIWRDVWLEKDPPAAAKMTVYRKGHRKPYTTIARFDEYAQTTRDGSINSMWIKMPANQLAKCAEALALRKAFPEQLGGLYSREEMEQADSKLAVIPREPEIMIDGEPATPVRALRPTVEKKIEQSSAIKLTENDVIPPKLLPSLKPLQHLGGIAFCDMQREELEAIAEHAPRVRGMWMQMPNVDERAIDVLQQMEVIAGTLLDAPVQQ